MAEYIIQEESLVELADIIREKLELLELDVKLVSNRNAITSVKIPDGVEKIGRYAFSDCENLEYIIIPTSVTSILDEAFSYCIRLRSITLPDSITSIGENVFRNCYSLNTINLPWSEGEVAGAPWGAPNATINYNYVEVS